jgi:hypothetical protein
MIVVMSQHTSNRIDSLREYGISYKTTVIEWMLNISAEFHVRLPDTEWQNTLTTVRFLMLALNMFQISLTAQPPDQEGSVLFGMVCGLRLAQECVPGLPLDSLKPAPYLEMDGPLSTGTRKVLGETHFPARASLPVVSERAVASARRNNFESSLNTLSSQAHTPSWCRVEVPCWRGLPNKAARMT